MRMRVLLMIVALMMYGTGSAHAAHPLITDDTGTQGKRKAQLEFTGEYGHGNEDGITTNTFIFPTIPVLSYGLSDTVDLVLGVPYERIEIKRGAHETTEHGISDISIQVKWRFYEKDGLSFAVKPGISLPTGNEDKGLGNGRASYSAFFITTKDAAPWTFHLNIGCLRTEYGLRTDEDVNRKDIWHLSLASQVEVVKRLKAVANIGVERNHEKASNADPAFLLGGFIYSLTGSLDVDFGVKGGLNKPETDISCLAGVTMKL
ncbi:MAG TPA: transporter [Nitrospirota bacterium]